MTSGVRALTVGDLMRARRPAFHRRVSHALRVIEEAARLGRLGCSFSGGKDSTVLLHLVRRVVPDAPAAFFDSGMEYPETTAFVAATPNCRIYPSQLSLSEMLQAGGHWGAEGDASLQFDFFGFLVAEPSQRFVFQEQLQVLAIGLRAQESAGRRLNARVRGPLYAVASGITHCCPLARWTTDDVWSYLALTGIPYNPIYDRMAAIEVPREEQRVSILVSNVAARWGGFARLRQLHPRLFGDLCARFPLLKGFT